MGDTIAPAPETLRFMAKQNEVNDQIFSKLNDIEKINVKQMDFLASIETQTIRTNGRVTCLEGQEIERQKAEAKKEGQLIMIKWGLGAVFTLASTPWLVNLAKYLITK